MLLFSSECGCFRPSQIQQLAGGGSQGGSEDLESDNVETAVRKA